MRIIAGKYRSRILKSLKKEALRPTSDRLRETLFDVLGADVAGSRFLDVFAGTGAVGIEALSRGAAEAVFLERHAAAAKLIRRNLDSLGITQGATIFTAGALTALEKLAARQTSSPRGNSAARAGALRAPFPAAPRTDEAPPKPQPTPGFDFVFLDPPYAAHEEYAKALEFLGSAPADFLAPGAKIIFEHHHKFALPEFSGRLTRTRFLKQGDAALSFFRPTA